MRGTKSVKFHVRFLTDVTGSVFFNCTDVRLVEVYCFVVTKFDTNNFQEETQDSDGVTFNSLDHAHTQKITLTPPPKKVKVHC